MKKLLGAFLLAGAFLTSQSTQAMLVAGDEFRQQRSKKGHQSGSRYRPRRSNINITETPTKPVVVAKKTGEVESVVELDAAPAQKSGGFAQRMRKAWQWGKDHKWTSAAIAAVSAAVVVGTTYYCYKNGFTLPWNLPAGPTNAPDIQGGNGAIRIGQTNNPGHGLPQDGGTPVGDGNGGCGVTQGHNGDCNGGANNDGTPGGGNGGANANPQWAKDLEAAFDANGKQIESKKVALCPREFQQYGLSWYNGGLPKDNRFTNFAKVAAPDGAEIIRTAQLTHEKLVEVMKDASSNNKNGVIVVNLREECVGNKCGGLCVDGKINGEISSRCAGNKMVEASTPCRWMTSRCASEEEVVLGSGGEYYSIPIAPKGCVTREEHIGKFLEIIEKAKSEGKQIIVHCKAGADRTSEAVGQFLLMHGADKETAITTAFDPQYHHDRCGFFEKELTAYAWPGVKTFRKQGYNAPSYQALFGLDANKINPHIQAGLCQKDYDYNVPSGTYEPNDDPQEILINRKLLNGLNQLAGSPIDQKSDEPIVRGDYLVQGSGRPRMEDTNAFYTTKKGQYIDGVFDGHGGAECAKIAARELPQEIERACAQGIGDGTCVKRAFLAVDGKCIAKDTSGSTALVAIVDKDKLTVAGAGDSRAVIARGDGRVEQLSNEHSAGSLLERERIEKAGGTVTKTDMQRVICENGAGLAVTRSLGDSKCKPYVIARPHIEQTTIGKGDQFMILGSDGLWDVMKNQQAVDFVKAKTREMGATFRSITQDQVKQIDKALVENADKLGSTDDITADIVVFNRS